MLSLLLAERLDGEVLNTDALALFKGADLMTAKPTRQERKKIKHHMLDVLEVGEMYYSVAQFKQQADECLNDVLNRKKLPIVVGGSNYYSETLIFEGGKRLESKESKLARIHPNDLRKIRNVEKAEDEETELMVDLLNPREGAHVVVLINNDEEFVKNRIADRINKMLFEFDGLKEVFWVLDHLFTWSASQQPDSLEAELTDENNRGVLQAIGYKEFLPLYNKVNQISEEPKRNTWFMKYRDRITDSIRESEPLSLLLAECIEKLKKNTFGLYKKQKHWLETRIVNNRALQNRLLYVQFDRTSLLQNSLFFEEIVEKCVSLLETEPLPVELPTLTPPSKLYTCEACKKHMTGERQRDVHFDSKGHKGVLASLNRAKEAEDCDPEKLFECNDCGKKMHGSRHYADHMKSNQHKKRIRKGASGANQQHPVNK